MDAKLKEYLNNIIDAGLKKNYWFITKQTMSDFYFIFTIARIIETYNSEKKPNETFGTYYSRFFRDDGYLNATFPKQSESEDTYRNSIIAEFFGLFERKNSKYESGKVTPAFSIIERYVKSHTDVDNYRFLMERQIEKLCLNVNDKIQNFSDLSAVKIFPVIFLYKILFELHARTGDSKLYYDEFIVFLFRTKSYSEWENVIELIQSYRKNGLDSESERSFDSITNDVTASNIRFDALFGTLSNLEYSKGQEKNYFKIKNSFESLRYIENAIEIFENSKYSKDLPSDELLDFLRSDKYFIGNLDVAFVMPTSKEEQKLDDDSIFEWIRKKGYEFTAENMEAESLYREFSVKYGETSLKALSDENLLNTMFLGKNPDNLCHELEYVKRNTELFGSIKGGNVYKYPLYYDKNKKSWMTGTGYNPIQITTSEAIIKGTKVRDALIKGIVTIQDSLPLINVEDYLALYTRLYSIMPDLVDSLWVTKYFHMMFPDCFPIFYNKDWQEKVLNTLKIEPNDATYGRLGQINGFVKKCQISNVVFSQVFHKYQTNLNNETLEKSTEDKNSVKRSTGATNIILYGVPGAGKSWTISNEYCPSEEFMERIVFHPDYTYSDFVGQILPKIDDNENISYVFVPGPFTKIVKRAYFDSDYMYYLIIEEINRGNAPAIFGDIFQLLDRDEYGNSQYAITNLDIAKEVYGDENHKVTIPSNLMILCTMNTSDQNVFTLDTAFQRRWNMRLIQNKFSEDGSEDDFAKTKILDTDVTWEKFFNEINSLILKKNIRMTSSEDKRIGTHFVRQSDLMYVEGNDRQNSMFAEKVLKYLWDDAFRFNKDELFDITKVDSLEKLIEVFTSMKGNERFTAIFKQNIYDSIVPKKEE